MRTTGVRVTRVRALHVSRDTCNVREQVKKLRVFKETHPLVDTLHVYT